MFKFIVLFFASLIGFTSISPSYVDDHIEENQFAPQRNYQHTEQVGNTEVVYKFETNEVNSVYDLVVGNIYYTEIDKDILQGFSNGNWFWCKGIYNLNGTNNAIMCDIETDDLVFIYKGSSSIIFGVRSNNVYYNFLTLYFDNMEFTTSFNFVHDSYNFTTSSWLYNNINEVSASDYNEIISVTYLEPTSVFGYFSEVLGDNLFGGIPNVDNVIFNVGGQDITLKSWLVTTTCIVLAVLTIILLILFIRFLFKLFANRLWH